MVSHVCSFQDEVGATCAVARHNTDVHLGLPQPQRVSKVETSIPRKDKGYDKHHF